MTRRVVITGVGAVSPTGLTAGETWGAVAAGKSGIGRISLFDPEGFGSRVAGEAKDFDPTLHMDRKEARRADRFTQFATAAANEALTESGYQIDPTDGTNVCVIVGTAFGGIMTLADEFGVLHSKGPSRVSPFLVPMFLPDMASGHLSIRLGAKGVNYSLASACASGADAIGEAANIIRRGDADVAICGGSEAPITPITIAGFASMKALTAFDGEPTRASRPFDATRDGFVLGEGAGILVLEAEEHATHRGAHILAELAGYGATSDAFHITQPDENGEGATRAMRKALKVAGLNSDDVSYVNTHGTSTPLNDKLETLALKNVFGDYAYALPVSSTKSMTGHLLGAAGALEAVISIMAMRHGVIPPTINLDQPDPECDLDYVPHTARSAALEVVMSNSLGFGGHNTSLVFRRYEPQRR